MTTLHAARLRQFHTSFDPTAVIAGPLHVEANGRVTMSLPAEVVAELIEEEEIEDPTELVGDIVEGWLGIRTDARALFRVKAAVGPGYASPPPARALPFIGALATAPASSRWLLTVEAWSPR